MKFRHAIAVTGLLSSTSTLATATPIQISDHVVQLGPGVPSSLDVGHSGTTTGPFNLDHERQLSPRADRISPWAAYGFGKAPGMVSRTFLDEPNDETTGSIGQVTHELLSVPEPSSLILLGVGLLGLSRYVRKHTRPA